jgi:hypothetical protein
MRSPRLQPAGGNTGADRFSQGSGTASHLSCSGPLGNVRFQVRTEADIAEAAWRAQQVGAIGAAYLLRARLSNRIAFWPPQPETSASTFKQLARLVADKPAVVLIGDDDYSPDAGPARWPVAARAVRWAAFVVVHAAGAKIEHYEAVISAAQRLRRVLLIECAAATADAWLALAVSAPNRPRVLLIAPTVGVHPIVPLRAMVQ